MISLRKAAGFTLVEVMIVVAIIALLAAIAVPNLLTARRAANDAAAVSSMRAISTAVETFAAAEGIYPGAEASLTAGDINTRYLSTDVIPPDGQFAHNYTFDYGTTSYTLFGEAVGPLAGTSYTITTGGVMTHN